VVVMPRVMWAAVATPRAAGAVRTTKEAVGDVAGGHTRGGRGRCRSHCKGDRNCSSGSWGLSRGGQSRSRGHSRGVRNNSSGGWVPRRSSRGCGRNFSMGCGKGGAEAVGPISEAHCAGEIRLDSPQLGRGVAGCGRCCRPPLGSVAGRLSGSVVGRLSGSVAGCLPGSAPTAAAVTEVSVVAGMVSPRVLGCVVRWPMCS
jgi:hypothetical protein